MLEQEGYSLAVCADNDPAAARTAIEELKPDLVISEISFCRADGIEFIRFLRRRHPRLPILIFSTLDEQVYAERMLSEGANGYIMKRAPTAELIAAIHRVRDGRIYLSAEVGASIIDRAVGERSARPSNPIDRLSTRELQVVQMIGKGLSTREIAGDLSLSIKTIESHRQRIKRKLNLDSGMQLVHFSISAGP